MENSVYLFFKSVFTSINMMLKIPLLFKLNIAEVFRDHGFVVCTFI